jgi:DNA phosphorothioation-associated putative methyltransferase
VLNVIEDPAERLEALVDAYRHARRLLVISGLICETVERATAAVLGDGVLTKRNTFQKYFEQGELQQYIEDALDCTAVPVALGSRQDVIEPCPDELTEFVPGVLRESFEGTLIHDFGTLRP